MLRMQNNRRGITCGIEIRVGMNYSQLCVFFSTNVPELHRLKLEHEVMRILRKKEHICVLHGL